MSATNFPDHSTRTRRVRSASATWSLIAAGLFLASGALQLVASLQRWVVFRYSRGEFGLEDDLFNYYFPHDRWENIGTTAQFFGLGFLLLALGVLVMAVGILVLPRTTTRLPVVVIVILHIVEIVVAALVAGSFAIHGAHALLSGLDGVPSPLQHYGALGWVGLIGLIVLAVRWRRKSPAAMTACVALVGATWLGYLVAAYLVAPFIAGYASHDATPWTETVIAAWTAAAGAAMIVAAVDARRRARPMVVLAQSAVVRVREKTTLSGSAPDALAEPSEL